MFVDVPPRSRTPPLFARDLPLDEERRTDRATIGRHPQIVRRLRVDQRHRVDAEGEGRPVRGCRVPHVAACQRVPLGQRAGELDEVAVVLLRRHVGDAGHGERRVGALPLPPVGVEEPQPVIHDRPADRRLVGGVVGDAAGALVVVLDLERRTRCPVRLVHVGPEAAGKAVAAALGDHVDDTAGEPAILGRDPGGQHLRLLDRILDEQVVGRGEQVVVDVDAVNQIDVVVGERPVDRDLAGVRRVGRQTRRQLGDPEQVPAHRELLHLVVDDVLADFGRGQRGRHHGGHGYVLFDRADLHRDVDLDRAAERDRHLAVDGREALQNERGIVSPRW